jgi:hypothetical protein
LPIIIQYIIIADLFGFFNQNAKLSAKSGKVFLQAQSDTKKTPFFSRFLTPTLQLSPFFDRKKWQCGFNQKLCQLVKNRGEILFVPTDGRKCKP